MARFRFPYVLTLSLSTLALGAVGCSNSHSPTEPAFDLETSKAAVSTVGDDSVAPSGDDSAVDKRRGRGGDDPAGDDRGGSGRGGDDRNGDDRNGDNRGRRGRGRDDRPANPPNPTNPQSPRAGQEFEGSVVAVNGSSLTLAGGTRIVVNGQTQWNARGDLFNLSQTAGSVRAGRPTRAEGRGTRQADGSILALTLKVEVDD
jgi:hypothetical protein